MGLDLVLYKKTKDILEMSMEEEFDAELAYGRKTWAIANFFMNICDTSDQYEYNFPITRAEWNTFIKAFEPYFKNEEFCEFIRNYQGYERHLDECVEFFLDRAFGIDEGYTLGAAWEAHAALQWYEANEEVQKAFDEGEVWLMVSF